MPRNTPVSIFEPPIKEGAKEARTIINCSSKKVLESWRMRCPKLEVIG